MDDDGPVVFAGPALSVQSAAGRERRLCAVALIEPRGREATACRRVWWAAHGAATVSC
jgi:hypothetical protein